jgi:hypothetical protein
MVVSLSAVCRMEIQLTKSCANTVYINLLITDEPGKQVSSAIKIKNVSRSHVAFKFQTTAPKSCFMRPPSGVLPPNGSIIATVVKFVEQPERPQEKKNKDKFKIVSLAVKADVEYTPELEELERLQKRLAEAEAAEAARKKPKEEKISKGTLVVEGLVIYEWVGVFQLNPFTLQSSVLTPSSCLSVNTSYCKELCGMFHVLHISWVLHCRFKTL